MQDTMFSAKNNILVTGIGSGLGQFLYEGIPSSEGLGRNNIDKILEGSYDTIVHCAFNTDPNDMEKFLDDNILLTEDLCSLSHKKFIYISSVDVYQSRDSEYNTAKRMAELIVQKYSEKYLIIRCSAILGRTMRESSFLKMYRYMNPVLTLHKNSTFNYVLQDDIMQFIGRSINDEITGVVDFVSSTSITLSSVNKMLKNKTLFGNYIYKTPNIDNSQLVKLFPQANKTSEDVIKEYINKYGNL